VPWTTLLRDLHEKAGQESWYLVHEYKHDSMRMKRCDGWEDEARFTMKVIFDLVKDNETGTTDGVAAGKTDKLWMLTLHVYLALRALVGIVETHNGPKVNLAPRVRIPS